MTKPPENPAQSKGPQPAPQPTRQKKKLTLEVTDVSEVLERKISPY